MSNSPATAQRVSAHPTGELEPLDLQSLAEAFGRCGQQRIDLEPFGNVLELGPCPAKPLYPAELSWLPLRRLLQKYRWCLARRALVAVRRCSPHRRRHRRPAARCRPDECRCAHESARLSSSRCCGCATAPNLLGALHGVDDGGEVDQKGVAHGFDHRTVMFSHCVLDKLVVDVEQPQHAGFVAAHLAAKADDVGEHDRGQRRVSVCTVRFFHVCGLFC